MRLVVIGGSAFSTPCLFRYLASKPCSDMLQVTLAGRSRERTLAVDRAARLLCETQRICIKSCGISHGELSMALSGADVVLLQIRPGGLAARAMDETFPLKYGMCGDEGLGISGLRAAWRTWPPMRTILDVIAEQCPKVIILLLTSPLGILARAAYKSFPQLSFVPLCELPWTTLKLIAARTGAVLGEIDFDYIGINHLGWFYRIEYSSRNLIEDYVTSLKETEESFPSRELVLKCSAVPTSYLRLHYFQQRVLEEQRNQRESRGRFLQNLSNEAMRVYGQGHRQDIMDSMGRRETPWYDEAVGPLIMALRNSQGPPPLFISAPNRGCIAGLPEDDILEIPHEYRNGSFIRRPSLTQGPTALKEMLARFLKYERLATEAILRRACDGLGDALFCHPWVRDTRVIPSVIDEITKDNSPN